MLLRRRQFNYYKINTEFLVKMNIYFFFAPVFSLACAIYLKHVEPGGTRSQFLLEANFCLQRQEGETYLQMQESALKVKMNW